MPKTEDDQTWAFVVTAAGGLLISISLFNT